MKELTNKIEIKNVVFAERWKERQEKCKEINKINLFRNILFRILVASSFTLIFIQSGLRSWGDYIGGNTLYFVIWVASIGSVLYGYGKVVAGFLEDVVDTMFVCNGHRPVFKKIGDIGAYASNMIHEYPTKIYYDRYNVEIIVENEKKKNIILQECEVEHQNITEPRLDLNQMKVILPLKC